MKLMNITLSVPYITYRVDVQYRIRRKPVIMEWVVIQMIDVAEKHHETYADVPVSYILEKIFSITDVDKLVRPVMVRMCSSGLMTVVGLTDEIPLQKIPLSACALTEDGRLMLRDGTLPSQQNRTELSLTYDVIHERLVSIKSLQAKSAGVPIYTTDELQNIPFPSQQIQSYIAQEQKKKTFPWLQAGTEIHAITPLQGENGTKVEWNNIQRSVNVSANGICQIEGFEASKILQSVAKQIPLSKEANAWPEISTEDIDSAIFSWTWPENWKELLAGNNTQRSVFILRESDASALPQTLDKKSHRVVLFSDSDSLRMEVQPPRLIVHINGTLLPPKFIMASNGFAICRGRFSLDFGGTRYEIPMAYVPRQELLDVPAFICEIVKRLASREPRLVILLLLTHQEEEFRKQTQVTVSAINDLSKRVQLLQTLKRLSDQFAGVRNKTVPNDWMEDLLIGADVISSHVHSAKEADAFLTHLKTILREIPGEHSSLLQKAALNVTMALPAPSGICETWNTLNILANADASCLSAVKNDESCLEHLYPRALINDFVTALNTELVQQAAGIRMPIERSVIKVLQAVNRILHEFEEQPGEEKCSAEHIRECIVKDGPEELRKLHEMTRQWNEAIENFSHQVLDFSEACKLSVFLQEKTEFMDKVIGVLEEFYDPRKLRYPNITVPDTNALLHHPELIEELQRNGKYLLLVPATVVQELDGLKQTDEQSPEADKKRAKTSRQISKKLVSLAEADAEWVQTGVQSNLNLIPEEIRNGGMENDMRILSIAVQYNAKPVFLITDDNNLKLISQNCHGIKTVSSDNFLQMLKRNKSTTPDNVKVKKQMSLPLCAGLSGDKSHEQS